MGVVSVVVACSVSSVEEGGGLSSVVDGEWPSSVVVVVVGGRLITAVVVGGLGLEVAVAVVLTSVLLSVVDGVWYAEELSVSVDEKALVGMNAVVVVAVGRLLSALWLMVDDEVVVPEHDVEVDLSKLIEELVVVESIAVV